MSVYRQELLLRSKDVDMYRRLRTSELFRLLQEASIRHTEELGMGRDKTLDKGILWVLLLQSAEIARMPEYDERIVLKSWPGRTMHLLFPRYYRLETAAGEHLLSASALWSLVDEKTRKVVFPERYGVEIEGVATGEEIALPSAPAFHRALQLCGPQRPHEQHPLLRPRGGLHPRRGRGARAQEHPDRVRERGPLRRELHGLLGRGKRRILHPGRGRKAGVSDADGI